MLVDFAANVCSRKLYGFSIEKKTIRKNKTPKKSKKEQRLLSKQKKECTFQKDCGIIYIDQYVEDQIEYEICDYYMEEEFGIATIPCDEPSRYYNMIADTYYLHIPFDIENELLEPDYEFPWPDYQESEYDSDDDFNPAYMNAIFSQRRLIDSWYHDPKNDHIWLPYYYPGRDYYRLCGLKYCMSCRYCDEFCESTYIRYKKEAVNSEIRQKANIMYACKMLSRINKKNIVRQFMLSRVLWNPKFSYINRIFTEMISSD
jgi:hypothetical protein